MTDGPVVTAADRAAATVIAIDHAPDLSLGARAGLTDAIATALAAVRAERERALNAASQRYVDETHRHEITRMEWKGVTRAAEAIARRADTLQARVTALEGALREARDELQYACSHRTPSLSCKICVLLETIDQARACGVAPMTNPVTAADHVLAREIVAGCRIEGAKVACVDCIAIALAAVRADERARCIEIVQTGAFVFQSDPPMAVTVERLEGLRAQVIKALAPGAGGTANA